MYLGLGEGLGVLDDDRCDPSLDMSSKPQRHLQGNICEQWYDIASFRQSQPIYLASCNGDSDGAFDEHIFRLVRLVF